MRHVSRRRAVRDGLWRCACALCLLAGTAAGAGNEPKRVRSGPATARFEERVIPTRDISRTVFRSPPYAFANRVECFPYEAWDSSAEKRLGAMTNRVYRVAVLENDFLRVVFIPEIGGRLWRAYAKRLQRELLASGTVLEPEELWKTGNGLMTSTRGLRFDFPEWGHDPSAEQPWRATVSQSMDTAYVREWYREPRTQLAIDVTFSLRADSTALAMRTTLRNPTAERRPYRYWSMAFVPTDESTRLIVPCRYLVYHAAERAWAWPVCRGEDLSRYAWWSRDTSCFAHHLTDRFSAVHSERRRSGLVRVFPPEIVPGVKLYSSGDPSYVHLYGGTGMTMEDDAYLEPGQVVAWTEWYYPLDGLPGLTAAGQEASVHAVLAGERHDTLVVDVLAVTPLAPGELRVTADAVSDGVRALTLEAGAVTEQRFAVQAYRPEAPATVQVTRAGMTLVEWRGPMKALLPFAERYPVEASSLAAAGIPNGGFEQVDPLSGAPRGWTPRIWKGEGTMRVTSGAAASGARSILLQGGADRCKIGYQSAGFVVRPGERYELEFAFQAAGLEPGLWEERGLVVLTDASGWHVISKIRLQTPTTGWQKVRHRFQVPETFRDLAVFLQLFGRGRLWFDDVGVRVLSSDAEVDRTAFEPTGRPAPVTTAASHGAAVEQPGSVVEGMAADLIVRHRALVSPLYGPTGLAIDAKDQLYFFEGHRHAAKGGRHVRKTDASGKLLASWGGWGAGNGQYYYPAGLAVHPDGRVFVADTGNHRLLSFSGDGQFLKAFGKKGRGPGDWDGPGGLAFTREGALLVVDIGNSRVVELALDRGSYRVVIGPTDLTYPFDVKTDHAGRIYVSNTGGHDVRVFDASGRRLMVIGGYGTGPGRFLSPGPIAVSARGTVAVADHRLARVSVFDDTGRLLRTIGDRQGRIPPFSRLAGLAFNSQGDLITVDSAAHRKILRFPADGGDAVPIVAEGAAFTTYPPLFKAGGFQLDGQGNLLFFSTDARELDFLYKTDPRGRLLWRLGSHGRGRAQFGRIGPLALDAQNNVWVLDRGNFRVHVFSSDGAYQASVGAGGSAPGALSHCVALAIGPSGDLYLSDVGNNRVTRLSSVGAHVATLGLEHREFYPGNLVVLPHGDVWVMDTAADTLVHFGPDGALLHEVPTGVVADDPVYVGYLVEDPTGCLLVLDRKRGRLLRFGPDGAVRPAASVSPKDVGHLLACLGLVFDKTGRIGFVTRTDQGIVVRWRAYLAPAQEDVSRQDGKDFKP